MITGSFLETSACTHLGPIIECQEHRQGNNQRRGQAGRSSRRPSGAGCSCSIVMQGETSPGQRRRLRGDTQVGWAGQKGLASPMPRSRALAKVSQYPVCSFTTPVGEESHIVFLVISKSPAVPASLQTKAPMHDGKK